MKTRTFGLMAAFMLAGTMGAGAQDAPDKRSESPGKAERSEKSPDAGSMKGSESRGVDKAQDRSAREEPRQERNRSAQDTKQDDGARESRKSSAESKGDKPRDKSAQGNKPEKDKSAESQGKVTDKSATRDKPDQSKSTAQEKPKDKATDKSTADSKADTDKSAAQDNSKQDKGQDSATGTSTGESGTATPGKVTEDKKKIDEVKSVQVTGERRERLVSAFKGHGDVKHETNVDINISVGTRAPQSWSFVTVPVAVVEIVPEYHGYLFAYAGDDYVVCDPDTYEIVAVFPANGGGTYAGGSSGASARCSASLTLNEQDREEIIRSVELSNELDLSGVSIGWQVPGDVELRTFPQTIVERRSELGACRYFIVNDQVAVVDPDQDKVVLMIEQH